MKICPKCLQEFEEEPGHDANPAEVLGDIFLDAVDGEKSGAGDTHDLCPACREKLGIINILGFDS